MTPARTQLLVYAFGPESAFEGQLVGALERIETGGTLRIVDAVFVGNDAETGELVAAGMRAGGAGGALAQLLEFRLDPDRRRETTERALDAGAGGVSGEALREIGQALGPGAALLAVLVEHAWAGTLEEAVARTGGAPVVDERVAAERLAELVPDLLAAARRGG